MLQQRSEQAQELVSKHEEMSMELQQMDAIRHKLTENIIYLQNEIRKRDDLLENSSEFGDFEMIEGGMDDADDSSSLNMEEMSNRGAGAAAADIHSMRGGEESHREVSSSQRQSFQMVKKAIKQKKTVTHSLQSKLDETRQQLKQRIEEKMQTERRLQYLEHVFRKLLGGFLDIKTVLD